MQARGVSSQVGPLSDVYSLGVVLYELLTGRKPFEGSRHEQMMRVLEDDPDRPRTHDPNVPPDLETICLKAMSKEPRRRYASARDMATDLHRFLDGEPIHARPVGLGERLWRWCRKNPLAVVAFAVILIGSALGFWHLTRLSRQLVERSALESAEQYADLLDLVNAGIITMEAATYASSNPEEFERSVNIV